MRGYVRASENTGVSFGIGSSIAYFPLVIFILPLLFLLFVWQMTAAFIRTKNLSSETKFICSVMVGASVLLVMLGHGSNCDLAGYCHQSRAQIDLTICGAFLLCAAAVVGFVDFVRHVI